MFKKNISWFLVVFGVLSTIVLFARCKDNGGKDESTSQLFSERTEQIESARLGINKTIQEISEESISSILEQPKTVALVQPGVESAEVVDNQSDPVFTVSRNNWLQISM